MKTTSHVVCFLALWLAVATSLSPSGNTVKRKPTQLCSRENDSSLPEAAIDRRSSLTAIASSMGLASASLVQSPEAQAAPKKSKSPRTYFQGKVTIQDSDLPPEIGGYKTILISARPKNPTSIPPEVVRSARGGVPAVFFAVVTNPTFPAKFKLTENDITPEGDFGLSSDPYWWAEEAEWEISARVDKDGAIRTLDPEDLVGRTITSQPGATTSDTDVCVAVKERGFFGSYYERKENS